jgi:class 3 adenylate cyclase
MSRTGDSTPQKHFFLRRAFWRESRPQNQQLSGSGRTGFVGSRETVDLRLLDEIRSGLTSDRFSVLDNVPNMRNQHYHDNEHSTRDVSEGAHQMSDDPKKPKVSIFSSGLGNLSDLLRGYPGSTFASPIASIFASGSMGDERVDLGSLGLLSYPDQAKVRSLEDEIRHLRDNLSKMTDALQEEKSASAGYKDRVAELMTTLDELTRKEQLAFLLPCVCAEAADVLLDSERLRTEFFSNEPRLLFAMSVDIRRSTDLMLKARTPQAFATFITTLCKDLMGVVRNNHGVVDKFTGDGILCFFPEFFSGPDAGYYALAAADGCHSTFDSHYRAERNSFQSVLKDVGLGIGVDYGECPLVQVAGGLTIVGAPVVYACRFGGAPAGKTYLNQPAYEAISKRHGGVVLLDETSIDIKHEGLLVAYAATLSRGGDYKPAQPAWIDAKRPAANISDIATEKKP